MGKIIHYTPDYYSPLKEYYLKTWSNRSIEYFDYRIKVIPENSNDVLENIIALNDKGEIVGCNFFLPTHALINGIDTKIYWSHDTIVDEKYRAELGTEMMLAIKGDNIFGAGLSLINYKIQKRMKTPFLGTEQNYIILNALSPLSLIKCFITRGSRVQLREINSVKVNGLEFKRITDISQITIPNQGYWFNVESDVEFIRDAHFIKKRFLHNFNKYDFYAHKNKEGKTDMYFVVRLTYRKGFPVLSIIDFRYDKNDKKALKTIIKGASKIARQNGIPFTLLCTTMHVDKKLYTFKLKENKCAAVLGPKKIKFINPGSIVFTLADADADFQTVE
jgi:hypothetical protein